MTDVWSDLRAMRLGTVANTAPAPVATVLPKTRHLTDATVMYLDIDSTMRCASCLPSAPRLAAYVAPSRRYAPWVVKWGKYITCDDCGRTFGENGPIS